MELVRHEAPVASIPGQLVATLRLDLVTPPEAKDCTNEETLLLVAKQFDDVTEAQGDDQEPPRTIA